MQINMLIAHKYSIILMDLLTLRFKLLVQQTVIIKKTLRLLFLYEVIF